MIELYVDEYDMAIWTDSKDEREFLEDLSILFSEMIERGQFIFDVYEENDKKLKEHFKHDRPYPLTAHLQSEPLMSRWKTQLEIWLPQIVDICCKMRGYKNNVKEKRVLISGDLSLSSHTPVAKYHSQHGINLHFSNGGREYPDREADSGRVDFLPDAQSE